MEERRRHKRFSVGIREIGGKMVLAEYVKILNISIGGVAFKADRRLNMGHEYTLKILGKGKELTVKGIVVRSLLSESVGDARGNVVPIYTAGMKFTDVTDEKLRDVAAFIENHLGDIDKQVDLFSSSGRRLYVRVRMENLEKSILKFSESYRVKDISLGGMRIESEYSLEIESTLPLELVLGEDKAFRFSGRVVSCNQVRDKDPEQYEVGIEFLDMSEEEKTELTEFLNSLEK